MKYQADPQVVKEDNGREKGEHKPVKNVRIVLVEPSHPGNIGGAARAMKTMGLQDLVIVNPRRYPDPQADWRAAGALDVLDAARVVDSVAEAIDDCHWVVGTSTRNRRIPWPVTDAKGIAQKILQQPSESKIAIMFGREDNGLSNEELQRCNYHLQVPAAPEYSSLNLAMAVQVVCYEIFQASFNAQLAAFSGMQASDENMAGRQGVINSTAAQVASAIADESAPGSLGKWDRRRATSAEIEAMLVHIEEVLLQKEFLQADQPGQTMTRLRRLFGRAQMDETEVQIFRGMFKHLSR